MITYLKMAEKNPSLLNKKIAFNTPNSEIPNQTFGSKQIVAGKEYTIRELLKYMVSYSDNNATYLLNSQVDLSVFRQVFSDLNIPSFTKNWANSGISLGACPHRPTLILLRLAAVIVLLINCITAGFCSVNK